jgi:hypothetical protein
LSMLVQRPVPYKDINKYGEPARFPLDFFSTARYRDLKNLDAAMLMGDLDLSRLETPSRDEDIEDLAADISTSLRVLWTATPPCGPGHSPGARHPGFLPRSGRRCSGETAFTGCG